MCFMCLMFRMCFSHCFLLFLDFSQSFVGCSLFFLVVSYVLLVSSFVAFCCFLLLLSFRPRCFLICLIGVVLFFLCCSQFFLGCSCLFVCLLLFFLLSYFFLGVSSCFVGVLLFSLVFLLFPENFLRNIRLNFGEKNPGNVQ